MKTNTTNIRELSVAELTTVNGGAANGASMSLSAGTDSLLSIEFKWQQGDNYQDYKLEAGKGINLNFDAFLNGTHLS
ncbi:hypothetical protein [Mucilaginibacter endophyticus]|uniref:hypothetical protein n=1 Tax=Mucilaginibacter endophyticus TaxID=2675003 RepID=UPI000E0CEE12|nr:hypothetical protein [Mucilaginibacter endophyticus]